MSGMSGICRERTCDPVRDHISMVTPLVQLPADASGNPGEPGEVCERQRARAIACRLISTIRADRSGFPVYSLSNFESQYNFHILGFPSYFPSISFYCSKRKTKKNLTFSKRLHR